MLLWNDEDHTYEYVIVMLHELFGHPPEKGFQIAQEVDLRGKAIVLTTTMEHAELKRDQIKAYGKDPGIKAWAGSMSSTIEACWSNADDPYCNARLPRQSIRNGVRPLGKGSSAVSYRDAADGEAADLCIVNTCTVTHEGDAKSRQTVRQMASASRCPHCGDGLLCHAGSGRSRIAPRRLRSNHR